MIKSTVKKMMNNRGNYNNLHILGCEEGDTITPPFDMTVRNDLDRYLLIMDTTDRRAGSLSAAAALGKAGQGPAIYQPTLRDLPMIRI